MSYQAKLKRYTLILEQLNRSRYPSASDLIATFHDSFDDQPEQIKLSCHPYLGNLLKSLPLHPSRKIESETAEETIVSLTVVINYEFTQRLLMMADQSHVISPTQLKEKMRKIIAEAQKNYQS